MEFNDEGLPDKRTKRQIVFLLLLLIAICALLYSTVAVYRYRDMLMNPVGQNLKNFNINTCTCLDSDGKTVIIDAIGYNHNDLNNSFYIG